MKQIIFTFLMISSLSACSSIEEKTKDFDKYFNEEFDIITQADSSYFYYILSASDKNEKETYEFIQLVNSIEIIVKDDKKSNKFLFDSKQVNKIGIPSEIEGNNVILAINKVFPSSSLHQAKELQVKFIFEEDKGYTIQHKFKAKNPNESISLYPVVLDENSDFLKFGLFSIRNQLIDEFIPNSEILRISINNYKGLSVFNSQEGGNYLQVIYPVFPESLGDFFVYDYTWNYLDNDKKLLPKGDYEIKIMIPALPTPYTDFLKFKQQ